MSTLSDEQRVDVSAVTEFEKILEASSEFVAARDVAIMGMIVERVGRAATSIADLQRTVCELAGLTVSLSSANRAVVGVNGDEITKAMRELLALVERLPRQERTSGAYVGSACPICSEPIVREEESATGRPLVVCTRNHVSYINSADANEATDQIAANEQRKQRNRTKRHKRGR